MCVLSLPHHGIDLEQILAPHAAIRAWRAQVAAATSPFWDEVHKPIHAVAALVAASPVA